jgi:hypothetical protein
MVMRGLPHRELTEEGKRLIGSIYTARGYTGDQAGAYEVRGMHHSASKLMVRSSMLHACLLPCLCTATEGCSCTAALVRWCQLIRFK